VVACLILCCAAKKRVDQLPVKSKKLKVRNRYFNYLVVSDEEQTPREPLKEFGKIYMSFL
jgi:hypothetical protein